MTQNEKTLQQLIDEQMELLNQTKRSAAASEKRVADYADKIGREDAQRGSKPKVAVPDVYKRTEPKENLSFSELLDFRQQQLEYDLRNPGKSIRTRQPSAVQSGRSTSSVQKPAAEKPGIPGLDEELEATRALIARSKELDKSRQRILDELAANPLEEKCDAVIAGVGRQLYKLENEELVEDTEAARFLESEDASEADEENLERTGQPPPLRVIK